MWSGRIWLQQFQFTCSIFELLVKCILYHLFGIGAYTNWWDTIPSKQQQQCPMCCPFLTLCWWTSCLKIQDVPDDDTEDCNLFWIILTIYGRAYFFPKNIGSTGSFFWPCLSSLLWSGSGIQVQSQHYHYPQHQQHCKPVSMRQQCWWRLFSLLLLQGYWSVLDD